MEVALRPSSSTPIPPQDYISTLRSFSNGTTDPTVEASSSSSTPSKPIRKTKKKKKQFNNSKYKDGSSDSSSPEKLGGGGGGGGVVRVLCRRRTPRVLFGGLRSREAEMDAIALPLGMSFAAVVAQVLEKNGGAQEKMSVDHLSQLCSSAIRESLANQVFGNKFSQFATNFENSFGSTLRTLRLINESSAHEVHSQKEEEYISDPTPHVLVDRGACSSNFCPKECRSEETLSGSEAQERLSTCEEIQENLLRVPANSEFRQYAETNQLACISPSTSGPVISTFERSVVEQTRSNDLKALELSLSMKRLKLKETQLGLHYDTNHLERSKLAMGVSKASFKAEKFKNQLEETRHGELCRTCIDCLVAGLLIMSFSLAYGAYIFSYRRITEVTSSCYPSIQASKSWWIPEPVASFNSGLQMLKCQIQVLSRMLFGLLMILAIAYLLLQRSTSTNQPVTFLLLLLGIACGFAGKLCVDTLGGSGYHWLLFWEILCMVHFLSNIWPSALFVILHGPIGVSEVTRSEAIIIPYWVRRTLFYSAVLVFLPLFCGLVPFGGPSEWKDHFSRLVVDSFTGDDDLNQQ